MKSPKCLNPGCTEWAKVHDEHACQCCGFDKKENKRRKAMIRENGLTPDRWGARRLVLK